ELLKVSLLSDEIRHALMTGNDVLSAVYRVEQIFVSQSPEFSGLEKIYRSEGLRGVEQHLTNAFLTFIVSTGLHPLIRTFFTRVIDSRNIMGLFKYTGMEFSALPTFLNNGSIPAARFSETIGPEDPSAATSLVHEVSGIRLDRNDPAQVEIALYTWISRYLKTAGRDPLNIGLIIDYLWRRSIEAMNLGVLHHGKDLERDAVIAALVS
ncbi:MAG TPA: V-type ATPase subunit, partial [Nitrospirota bacterium]